MFWYVIFLCLFINTVAISMNGLHVVGNQIQNNQNQVVRLIGANRSGGEYMCVQNNGIWDGPMDQSSISVMMSWGINTVRVPLNEQCWLGINGINPQYSGSNYQSAVVAYVDLLTSNGLAVILDLHWTAAGTNLADGQAAMPNTDHSVAFWTDCASTFKSYSNVIFDLFNEPFPGGPCSGSCNTSLWSCWRDGGNACSQLNLGYTAAGMQTLLNAVRGAGAQNPVMLGGLSYSNTLTTMWLTYQPVDTLSCPQIIASWHSYNFNYYSTQSLWDSCVAPVLAQVPVIVGEIGENDCASSYINSLMPYLDGKGASYLAWAWNTAACTAPSLITNYTSGATTNFGAGYKAHLASMNFTSSQTPITQPPGTCPTPPPTTPSPPTTTTTAGPSSTLGPTSPSTLSVTKVTGWNDYYIQISIIPNNNVASVSASYTANGAVQVIPLSPAPASWNVPQYISSSGLSVAMPNPTPVTITVVMNNGTNQVYTLWNGNAPPTTSTMTPSSIGTGTPAPQSLKNNTLTSSSSKLTFVMTFMISTLAALLL